SYPSSYPWNRDIQAGIESTFDETGIDYDLTVEYMDTKRNTPEKMFHQLLELYKCKYN
ncbi:hypothetical protein C5S39_04755, partial [Candidatus Methanophagaceae archaeon]